MLSYTERLQYLSQIYSIIAATNHSFWGPGEEVTATSASTLDLAKHTWMSKNKQVIRRKLRKTDRPTDQQTDMRANSEDII